MQCYHFVQDKASPTVDFILSSMGRLESEKHSLALKEVVALTRRYPHLLTANLINRVSNLEEGGITTSPATKTCILELKSEYHSRSRERLEKLNSNATAVAAAAGVTVVNVGGDRLYNSRPDISAAAVAAAAAAAARGSSNILSLANFSPMHNQPNYISSAAVSRCFLVLNEYVFFHFEM